MLSTNDAKNIQNINNEKPTVFQSIVVKSVKFGIREIKVTLKKMAVDIFRDEETGSQSKIGTAGFTPGDTVSNAHLPLDVRSL